MEGQITVLKKRKKNLNDSIRYILNKNRFSGPLLYRVQSDPGKPGKMAIFRKTQGKPGKLREKKMKSSWAQEKLREFFVFWKLWFFVFTKIHDASNIITSNTFVTIRCITTVKPVYNNHFWDHKNVVVIDRWSYCKNTVTN